jgi:hypothetical protein
VPMVDRSRLPMCGCGGAFDGAPGRWLPAPAAASQQPQPQHGGRCGERVRAVVGDYMSFEWYASAKLCYLTKDDAPRMHNHNLLARSSAWRWQPDACNVHGFDARSFAQQLANRTVYVVGDSLSMSMWQAMACELHSEIDLKGSQRANLDVMRSGSLIPECGTAAYAAANASSRSARCFTRGREPKTAGRYRAGAFALRGGGRVEFMATDRLVDATGQRLATDPYWAEPWWLFNRTQLPGRMVSKPYARDRRQTAWSRRLSRSATPRDVLVINTGSHFTHPVPRAERLASYETAVRATFRFLATLARRRDGTPSSGRLPGTVIWRDTYGGIDTPCLTADDWQNSTLFASKRFVNRTLPARPLLSQMEKELHLRAGLEPGRDLSYPSTLVESWADAGVMNAMAEAIAHEEMPQSITSANRVRFQRISNAMSQRCDRNDNRHFCHPGPAASWVHALHHDLLECPR